MAFHLADGREVTVLKGWRGNPREQDFLREVFVGACRYFATVLGPGADMFHYDHFHIDLARHDPRGERTICKPILKFMPRLDRAPTAGERLPATAAAEIPLDIEEDAPGEGRPMAGGGSAPDAPSDLPPARAIRRPGPSIRRARSSLAHAAPAPARRERRAAAADPACDPVPEPYRAPLYNRPPVAGQPPQLLNGHGIY